MNAENAQKLARRFIELPLEKRRLFLEGLREEGVDFSLFPIPADVASIDREELSYAERRMWMLWRLEPQSAAYNLPSAVHLQGELDVAILHRAFNVLVSRHETLRSAFNIVSDLPVRHIKPEEPLALEFKDLSGLRGAEQQVQAKWLAEQEALQPFDLAHGSLLRVKLLRLSEYEHVLLVTLHHIVSDGWSMNVLINEFSQLYWAFSMGRPSPLVELPIQYSDYALWQRKWLEAGETQRQLDYWIGQLGHEHSLLELPTDFVRPARPSYRGARLELSIESGLSEGLRSLARRRGVTLFMLLLASFQALLQRYSGQNDIRVGVPIANRNRSETEHLIGFFVNTQVLRCTFDGYSRFSELLQQLKQVALGAQAHQELPFEQLVEALQVERSLSHNPLFQVLFNHQPMVTDITALNSLGDLSLSRYEWEVRTTPFDLSLDTVEKSGRLEAVLTYATDLFERATAERMLRHWLNVLRAIVADSEQRISELPLLDESEKRQLQAWGSGAVHYPGNQCVHELIEAQAVKTPKAIALVFAEQQLTYEQLNCQANQLAHALIERGVGPDVLVGIMVERGLDVVVGLLAILKAGGAYVPLDPEYPGERLIYMLEDSGVELLLTHTGLLTRLSLPRGVDPLCLDEELVQKKLAGYPASNPLSQTTANNLVYMLYTSGSTGRPKGIAMPHRVISQLNAWQLQRLPGAFRTLLFASPCFDVAFQEVTSTLCSGGSLVQTNDSQRHDFSLLLELVISASVERLYLPFAVLQLFAEAALSSGKRLPSLQQVITAGEQLKLTSTLVEWLEHETQCCLINQYGPTESHVVSDFLVADLHESELPPIGVPASNAHLHVLDAYLQILPTGMTGELCIGSTVLARGYFSRPALTAERFIPDPYDSSEQGGGRLYRTGDLAHQCPEGVIDYLGRIDHQVKIRGFRIELGEIEARLLTHEGVSEAAVIDIEGAGGRQLAGYVVPRDAQLCGIEPEQQAQWRIALKEYLKEVLPEYMVPVHLLFLDALPLTSNGKLNRKALPKPDVSLLQHGYVAPQGEWEQRIATIWADVLKVERVGRYDNFFEMGGHSLLATQVISRIRQSLDIELPLRTLFEAQELSGFAQQVAQGQASRAPVFSIVDRAQPLSLSYAQQRQWFLWKLEPESAAYHIPAALRLKGDLDIEALQRSFESLIQRHETLRTTFTQESEQAIQIIHATGSFQFEQDQLPVDASSDLDKQLKIYIEDEVKKPFDLEHGPLLRVKLLRLAKDDHILILTLHHIVTDGWSSSVMVDELVQLYEGYSQGQSVDLPELPIQYADYAIWQREWMEAGEQERQLAYWQEQLGGEQPILELPTDHRRLAVQRYEGARLDIPLKSELAEGLNKLAREQGATMFMALLASFQALLHYYSGQADIRVGVPIANRTHEETERLIGFFVNTQVLKAEFDLDTTFEGLLQQVKQRALGAQAHQDLPFEQLVEALQPERSLSHSPLFQVMYNHRIAVKGEARHLAGLSVEGVAWDSSTAQFDLTLDTYESEEGIHASLTYATDLFERSTVESMAQHWIQLLESIIEHPQQRLGELPLLSPEEQQQIVYDWNRTEAQYPSDQCIHQLIEAQAEKTPGAVAVIFADQELTYQELNRKANQLAHKLRELGVGPDVLVGIAVERSLEMVIGLLAILKAGGAYVPLDPEYPRERLAYMVEDSGIGLLLTQSSVQVGMPDLPGVLSLYLDQEANWLEEYGDDDPVPRARYDSAAYIIFTSGSTGMPKGVTIPHGAFAMHCQAAAQRYGITDRDCMLQFASISFDAAAEQIFMSLAFGLRLLLGEVKQWSVEQLLERVKRHGVSILNLPPAYLAHLSESLDRAGKVVDIRLCILGGEAWSHGLLSGAIRASHIFNAYGPTEAVVTPLIWKAEFGSFEGYAPIGRPVGARSAYVLDEGMNLLPSNGSGELYLGGEGLARGYHDRPVLTAERFVPDPFGSGEQGGNRLYRTGDLAKYRADGVLEYLGRIDHQVKIRGFRIELGEIESRLQEHEAIHESVVLDIDGPAGKQLAAYLVLSADRATDSEQQSELRTSLRDYLSERLPDYMVPAHLIFLEALPLTPNGKLDRKALPRPDVSQLQQAYVAPRSELEQRIAAIWADVLKVERVGLTDNFFELGGDSIISIQVVSRARQAGIRFTPKELFLHQTVQGLASVAQQGASTGLKIYQGLVNGQALLLPIHQWFFDSEIPEHHHWNQSLLLKPGKVLSSETLQRALQELITHHDALRLGFSRQTDGAWAAQYHSLSEQQHAWGQNPILWTVDVEGEQALEDLCNEAQRSLNLQDGPLLRAVLATLADGSQRLLLAIHHQVVDGVSWRILLEDLQTAYAQLGIGQVVSLPSKTSSTKAWAEHLRDYAASEALQKELLYWKAELADASAELPCDNPEGSLQGLYTASAQTRLSQTCTRQLLQHAPSAYRTQVNDLLLTALARVIARWTARSDVLIQLEGHGREDLFDDIDLTRTVGWFTSVFPVKLTPTETLDGSIKRVKEQLRSIPNKGIGFGALRYLGEEQTQQALAQLSVPRITFNYLGQFDGSFAQEQDDGEGAFLTPALESPGASQSELAPLGNWLSINGQVYGGELSLNWSFSREMFKAETIQRLAQEYTEELEALIAHCTDENTFGLTPSDVPLAGLSQEQLDVLPIPSGDIEDIYPLSPMQQGMLFHTLYAQEGGDYINQMRVDVDGLDVERFQQAWQTAVDRHEVLRASFVTQFEQPLQVIRRQMEISFTSLDWSAQADIQKSLDTWTEADRQKGFDLLNDPLLRIAVIRTDENSHQLIYTSHHILMDGWSNSQLLGEVLQAYAGVLSNPQTGRYRDYIDWLLKQDKAISEVFWKAQLKDLQEPTRLAQAIRQDKADLGTGHGDHYQVLDQRQTQRLSEFARQHRVTVNTLVQAAWLLLLQRYTGQDTISFGATVAGRPAELKGVEQQLGLFINTLPVIASPKPEQSVAQWIEQVQAQNLALREHEHTALYEVQRWAGLGGEALFDNILVFENYPISEALQQGAPDGLKFGVAANQEQTNYPLTLAISLGDALLVHYRYDNEHFSTAVVQKIAQHFGNLLQALTQQAQQTLGELPLLSQEEQKQIVYDWNRTEASYPSDQCIHQLIEAQAEKTPDAVAVIFGEQALTYQQLNQRSNQLAHKLRELGVGPDVLVGIAVERSLEMVVGLLAILKAGGAYVPLDPEYPQERLAYMMAHSEARILLTLESLVDHIPAANAITWCLDRDWHEIAHYSKATPEFASDPENLAYCIYTSGSTGKPKGVTIRHRALVNFLVSMEKQPGLDACDRVLALTSLSFDIAGLELYLSLMVGASLVLLAGQENRDPQALLSLIERQAVNTIQATPSTWRMLLDVAPVNAFQNCRLISGGEALAPDLAERLLRQAGCAWNLYGPTETTIWSGAYCLDAEHSLPLLGKPIANTSMYLLDASFEILPIGVAGELLIGGEGLARGYHLRSSLTAERFIPDPFDGSEQGGGRLYRTGDLARYHPDGVIEYVSRIDHQVKIRGFRIELGEIEANLLEHSAVREAVVIDVDGASGRQLVAYLVSISALDVEQQHQLRNGLRDKLRSNLPDYMIPAHLLFLDKLPLTPNGKLDRKALPKPDASQLQQAYVAPQSDLEQQIAAIWADVLKVEKVGLTDNFFELGGHSLLATQVISRIRQALNIELPLRTLFEAPVLMEFVAHARQGVSSTAPDFERVDRTQPLALSYAQQRQWFLWQLEPQSAAYNMPTALRFKGELDIEALRSSFETLITRHESLRTTFRQDGEQAVQVTQPGIDFALAQEELDDASEALIQSKVEEEVSRPFDLEQGPLLRVKLLRLAKDDHVLVLTLHHIVSDGWSMPIMVDELVQLYEGNRTGQQVTLPELPIQYADYAIWQRSWMEAGEQERQLTYWKAQLGDEQPVLELPTDRPRPAIQGQEGANFNIEFNNKLAQSLKQLAQQQGVTLFMLLLASFQTLLHRYSGQDDIRVGVPNANRNRMETERLIGFFVNTQVLKAEFDLGTTFSGLLQQVQQAALGAQEHQDLPFEQLVEALHPERSLSHSPLFQVMFNHQSQVKGESRQLSGLIVEGLSWEKQTAQFDLALDTFEYSEGIGASLNYATDLFDRATIERLAGHWLNLLQGIVKAPDQRVAELPLLSAEEQQQIVYDWNRTEASYPTNQCIHQLIEVQASKTPDAVAV
ncbi:non-ribosomal peptide synthase/polyketide synthase, partial [Stutzerimonas kirkiae]|uniref:non-ribosomal peptide synthase/polyketide synthase n=1 Tax=Stutzerimonas kirkiae TaxID=2211392 RepID=UPI00103834AC